MISYMLRVMMSYNHGDFVILIRVTQIYPHGDHGEDVTAIFGDDVIFTHGDDVTDTHGDNIIASHGNDVIATHCDDITAVLCDYVISTHGDDVTAVLGHFFMAFHIIVIYKGVGVFHILGVGGWWGGGGVSPGQTTYSKKWTVTPGSVPLSTAEHLAFMLLNSFQRSFLQDCNFLDLTVMQFCSLLSAKAAFSSFHSLVLETTSSARAQTTLPIVQYCTKESGLWHCHCHQSASLTH